MPLHSLPPPKVLNWCMNGKQCCTSLCFLRPICTYFKDILKSLCWCNLSTKQLGLYLCGCHILVQPQDKTRWMGTDAMPIMFWWQGSDVSRSAWENLQAPRSMHKSNWLRFCVRCQKLKGLEIPSFISNTTWNHTHAARLLNIGKNPKEFNLNHSNMLVIVTLYCRQAHTPHQPG